MNRHTFYNPKTNHIKRANRFGAEASSVHRLGYENLGCEKVAEAFTSVTSEERIKLWNSFFKRTYSFDFSELPSKLRHKLKKLGLWQLPVIPLYDGEELLDKINKKTKQQ